MSLAIALATAPASAPLLTPAKERMILMFVRAGATDYVACEAVGISKAMFDRWMDPEQTPALETFRANVIEARGQARVRAEVRVAAMDPEKWLTRGPGRERPGRPGWSVGRVEVTGPNGGPVSVAPGVDLSKLSEAELAQMEQLLTKARTG